MVKDGTQTQGQWKANLGYLQGQSQLQLAAVFLLRVKNHCTWRVALQCKPNCANKVLHRPPAWLRIPCVCEAAAEQSWHWQWPGCAPRQNSGRLCSLCRAELIGRGSPWLCSLPGEPAEDDIASSHSLETHLWKEGKGEQTHPVPQKQGH